MKVDNLALQHIVRFTGNKSDFTKQPIFLMSNNIGLTGDDFIALYRITRGQGNNNTYRESDDIPVTGELNAISGDGVLGITVGSSQGITSATGSNRITANSVNVGASSFTAAGNSYTIVTSMKGTEDINVIISRNILNKKNNYTNDLLTGMAIRSFKFDKYFSDKKIKEKKIILNVLKDKKFSNKFKYDSNLVNSRC